MKILIAVDGSPYTRAAARYVVGQRQSFASPLAIHLLHVQPPIPYPGAAAVAGKAAVESYQRDESLAALAPAEKELAKAGVAFTSAWRVGDVAQTVEKYAREQDTDLVISGSHGHGALASLAMGSVTTKLLATLSVPLLVITRGAAARADRKPGDAQGDSAGERKAVATP
jgi:nucleotide-binding universal stress UspA family protein